MPTDPSSAQVHISKLLSSVLLHPNFPASRAESAALHCGADALVRAGPPGPALLRLARMHVFLLLLEGLASSCWSTARWGTRAQRGVRRTGFYCALRTKSQAVRWRRDDPYCRRVRIGQELI